MRDFMYDVIIIGGGIAGMTAAIYSGRRELKTLILSKTFGGQMAITSEIENWPGSGLINGNDLSQKIQDQVKLFGSKSLNEYARKIKKYKNFFEVSTPSNQYRAKVLILSYGKTPRRLNIPGEKEFEGRGVSFCVNCDGRFFKGKTVAVVGGGNSALEAAQVMAKLSPKVYLIHRRDQFRGEEYLIEKNKKTKIIEIITNSNVLKILGKDKVESILLNNRKKLPLSAIFIEIGYEVNDSLVKNIVKTDNRKQIIVNQHQETSVPGIFAAGDLTNTPYQQLVIAAGEGATAALSAARYIQKNY